MKKGGRSKPVIGLALIALLVILGFAVVSTVSKVSQPGKSDLVVGTNTPFPPFEMRKGENVVGFDMDIAKHIAEAMGRQLVVKDFSNFDALFPSLQTGSLDMIISSVTIQEDRKEVLDFSDSYFDASQAVLAKKGFYFSYSGDPNQFKGLRVGYQAGTTSQSWVEQNLLNQVAIGKFPFGDVAVGLEFLMSGSVDILIIDGPAASGFAKTNVDFMVAGIIETGEKYGIAVAKGDPQGLLPVVNKVLRQLKESGEYDKLIAKWFGGEGK